MGVIKYKDILYGGGSNVEPNPQNTASGNLTKVGIDGDVYDIKDANAAPNTPTFTEASTRANLSGSGETMATILGKIKKWFTDLGTAAFKNVPSSGNASTTEVVMGDDTRLSDSRTPTAHNQASDTINAMTGYSKPSSTSAIATNDTLNAAIGKLEKALDGKSGTDENVKQENTTTNADYRVLLSKDANDTTGTSTARKSTNIKFNPSTGILSTVKLLLSKALNRLLTGTGTAGRDKGSGQTNRYVPSEWKFNAGITPVDGDEITIKIPVAGISYGVWLSVDNGTTYYPVGRNDTSRLQTQFANGTTIHLVFQTNANMSMYARGGADSSTTYTGNYWKVVNYYDSNTTYSVVSTSANGLAPKVTDTSKFLKGDGTWAAPTDSTKIPLAGTTALTGSIVPSTDKSISLGDLTKTFYSAFAAMFAAGRAGNQTGSVRFFHSGESSLYTDLMPTKPTSIQTLYLPNSSGTLATQAWATQEINLDGTMTFTNTSYSGGSTTRSYAARAIRGTRMVWLVGGAGSMNFSSFPTSNTFHKIASGLPKAKYTIQFWMIGMRSTTAGCVFQIDGNGDLTCNVSGQSSRVNDWCWFNYWYLAADSYF